MYYDWNKVDEVLEHLSQLIGTMELIDLSIPEHAGKAASAVSTIQNHISDLSQAFKNAEKPIEELGGSLKRRKYFEDSLDDISAASSSLAVHIQVLSMLSTWMEDENPYDPPEKGLEVFDKAAELARSINAPESVTELHKTHISLLEMLDSYHSIFSKFGEATRTGDGEIARQASEELSLLDKKLAAEPIEMYSLQDLITRARIAFDALKEELT